MSIRTAAWPAGMPCWVDVSTPDVVAASAFYSAVLGWAVAEPDEEYGGYVMATVGEAMAAGIGPVMAGAAPAWTLYLATDDADKTAEAVTEYGGTVLVPPLDVGTLGRMFMASDPTGAVFGAWQMISFIGATIVNEPGGLVWEDLRSPDPDAARAFYSSVFGYETSPRPDAGPGFHTFGLPGDPAPLGGMGGTDEPPHWSVYFSVADVAAATAAAEAAGATLLRPPVQTPFGARVTLRDPWGAVFTLSEDSSGTRQPDRT